MSDPRPFIVPREPTRRERVPNHLPLQPTPFIGREREVEAVCTLLRRPEVRLLTLVGPPGIGKTRLGIQAAADLADDFPDGLCFVSIAPVTDPDLVVSAVLQALGLPETSNQPLLDGLKDYLLTRQMLLLVDNFEHVVTAASLLAELVVTCPGVKILVTSRELLHVYGEYDYLVPPLSLPDAGRRQDLETLSQHEALQLFVQRAQAVSTNFVLTESNASAVAEICLRLDGLPLAIELAAARVLVLQPEELLARLNSRLTLLTGGARNLPERQRTLRATIDWSHNLLAPVEQTLFRRLGVFVGGCTLDAVAQVCGSHPGMETLDVVTSLVGKSLLQRQEAVAGEPRFLMLETLHEYARGKLEESGEFDSTAHDHFDYFLHLAEKAEQESFGHEQILWMRRLDAEQNNLRAALAWNLSRDSSGGGRMPAGRTEMGLRLVGALGGYWDDRGYFSEGRQWCTQLLSKTEPGTEGAQPSAECAKALRTLARMIFEQGDFTEARGVFEKSLEMSRVLGDDFGMAAALNGMGTVEMWQGEYDLSQSLYEQSLAIARRLGSKRVIKSALSNMGVILMRKGEYQAAQLPLMEALAINRELGDGAGIAVTLTQQGSLAFHLGEYEKAKILIEESLGIARELGVEYAIAFCLARLGMIALRQGDLQHAEALLVDGLTRARSSGIRRWSRWYLVGLAEVARLRGMVTRAAQLLGASEGVLSAAGAHYEPATRAEIDRIIASVRAELDEEVFERLRAEGRAMSLEEIYAHTSRPTKAGATIATEGQHVYPDDLTEREVEVLRLIAVGKSNQEIGQDLVLSRRTVERHVSNIYQKIGASGKVARATASAYALRHGLAT